MRLLISVVLSLAFSVNDAEDKGSIRLAAYVYRAADSSRSSWHGVTNRLSAAHNLPGDPKVWSQRTEAFLKSLPQ
jgi:hypothetical protein